MKRSNPLRLERLEDRTNPSSLTVSFVPDGTQVGTLQSQLYQLTAGTSPAVWQQTILGELQTAISPLRPGVTLSIVPDDGASMNAPAPQDGAIRVAAVNEVFNSNGSVITLPWARTSWSPAAPAPRSARAWPGRPERRTARHAPAGRPGG